MMQTLQPGDKDLSINVKGEAKVRTKIKPPNNDQQAACFLDSPHSYNTQQPEDKAFLSFAGDCYCHPKKLQMIIYKSENMVLSLA